MEANSALPVIEDEALIASQVMVERIRVFADRLYVGTLAKPLGILMILLIGGAGAGWAKAATWLGLIGCIEVLLIVFTRRYRQAQPTMADMPRIVRKFNILTGLTGLAWGSSVFFFWDDSQFLVFVFDVMVLVGVAGIALLIMSPLPTALVLFHAGLLLPPVLCDIRAGLPHVTEILGGLSVLAGLLAYYGRVAEEELVSNLEATARNAILNRRLATARDTIAASHRELERKNDALVEAMTQLNAGEERLRLAFQAAQQGWFDVSLRTGDIVVSPEYARLLGFDPDSFRPDLTSWFANVHEEDLARVRRTFYESLGGDETVEVVYRRRAQSGDWRWISSIGRVVERDGDGKALRVTGIHTDITERKRAEQELRESKERFERTAETVPVVLYDYLSHPDGSNRFLYVSHRCREVLGLEAASVVADASGFWRLVHPADFARVQQESLEASRVGGCFRSEFRIITPAGEMKWLHVESNPTPAAPGQPAVRSGFLLDVTDRKHMEEELRTLATTDFLTGLTTRRSFIVRLEDELARLQRTSDQPIALLMLDLDHFKRVNDDNGHAVGDALLKHFSVIVVNELRRIDLAGRLGGEEFGIILPGADATAAGVFAERLRQRIADSPLLGCGTPIYFTVSVGVTHLRAIDNDPDAALVRADRALYRAKQTGRNRVELADDAF